MKTFYRSVWISDAHLCSPDSQSDMLQSFLDSIRCDYLYMVGDMIDVWALRNKWHWPRQYNEVVHKLLKRSRKGAKIIYIPGNHDEFFRDFVGYTFGDVEIRLQSFHTTADGRRFLVIHGDEFDTIVRFKPWLSHLGNWAYRHLITMNRAVNYVRRLFGWPYWSFSRAMARKVGGAVRHLRNYEELLTRAARRRNADGVICGHSHKPDMREINGVLYCNTGDWMHHCTALVEHEDGRLEMIWWADEVAKAKRSSDESPNDPPPPAPKPRRFTPRAWLRRPAPLADTVVTEAPGTPTKA